jgi:HD-GYP domain-containing protein (c-di-GMP phosphodiesterase class II)
MRIVSVDELTEDMVLTREIIDQETGRILLGSGTSKLPQFASRLQTIGVNYLFVEDSIAADLDIPVSISAEMRRSAEQSLEQVFAQCELDQRPEYLIVRRLVQDLLAEVLSNREVLLNIYEMRCNGGSFLTHSVNVAVLSLVVGIHLGYDSEKLKKLGLGALLHDIGVAGMPKTLLANRNKLTLEEKLLYEQHTVIGYNRVKESWDVSVQSRSVILGHHERSNGTGYPHRLLQGDISDFARIVGMVDCLEELAGGHPFSQQLNIQEAIEQLTINAAAWFDYELVSEFVKLIPIYQVGATARLLDGARGVVLSQNEGFPTRPVIRIFLDTAGNRIEPGIDVDLMKNHHLILR